MLEVRESTFTRTIHKPFTNLTQILHEPYTNHTQAHHNEGNHYQPILRNSPSSQYGESKKIIQTVDVFAALMFLDTTPKIRN